MLSMNAEEITQSEYASMCKNFDARLPEKLLLLQHLVIMSSLENLYALCM